MSDGTLEYLGDSRPRGILELVVWAAIAGILPGALLWQGGGAAGWLLAAILLAALVHYALKSLRTVRGDGRLVADGRRRAFYRGDRRIVAFDDVAALRSHLVNGSCAEFELAAQCRDGHRLVLYEGEATNAAYRTVERMASLAGVPFHHTL